LLPVLEADSGTSSPSNPEGRAPAHNSNTPPSASPISMMLPTIKADAEVRDKNNSAELTAKFMVSPEVEPTIPPTVKLTQPTYDDLDVVVAPTTNYSQLEMFGHNGTAFTQGLYYDQDRRLLIESTGMYGESLVRIWDPRSGTVQQETSTLDEQYFAEGLTWFRDADGSEKLIQLTYKNQSAFIYDMDLNLLQTLAFDTTTGEGWGITFDPNEQVFYVSDGSEYIHVWNLDLQEIRNCSVSWTQATGRNAVRNLNELEWDPTDGTILANVWKDTIIVRIWPANGNVVQVYEMKQLGSWEGVLNGIAHYSDNKWWITGKNWRRLYLLEFLE